MSVDPAHTICVPSRRLESSYRKGVAVGRLNGGIAVVTLACDPGVVRRSGKALAVGDLAREYGFSDLDGRRPTAYPIEK